MSKAKKKAQRILSYCESVHAGGASRWHLRWLDKAGPKFGGGITTGCLCGHVKAGNGWDINAPIDWRNIRDVAPACLEALAKREEQ